MPITKSFEILNKAQAEWLSWHTVVSFGPEQVQMLKEESMMEIMLGIINSGRILHIWILL
jgi:hypothetical protein